MTQDWIGWFRRPLVLLLSRLSLGPGPESCFRNLLYRNFLMLKSPPTVIEAARVIAYAVIDESVRWTGLQRHYVGDDLLGRVPGLAICQPVFGDDLRYLLFFCSEDWNVLGVRPSDSVDDHVKRAENWYEGVSAKWVYTNTTRETAEQFLRARDAASRCSFCEKIPAEVESMFVSNKSISNSFAHICSECVNRFYKIDSEMI